MVFGTLDQQRPTGKGQEAHCNNVEVFLEPGLAGPALQGCDGQIHQPSLHSQFSCASQKLEQAVLGGLAGLLGQLVKLPCQCLSGQRPAAVTADEMTASDAQLL